MGSIFHKIHGATIIGNDVAGSSAKESLKPIWCGLEYIFKLGFSIFARLIEILSRSHPVNSNECKCACFVHLKYESLPMLALFLKGLVIGFAIAAPVGPIGVLCIQRSLHDGFKIGLMTGIGAALADGTYGLIAAFGLTAISSMLVAHQFWIRIIGGLFLLYLGVKIFLTPPRERSAVGNSDRSPWHACATTYFLTITNPMTILSFVAIFAGLGLGSTSVDYTGAVLLVIGITLGSAIWWLLLSGGVAYILHKRVNPFLMKIINWISGSIILIFGLIALSVLI